MTFYVVESRDEARAVSKLARAVFGFGSRLTVPRQPNWAIYACDNTGTIVGGIILKRLGQNVGMVDFIFVCEQGRGQGLGTQLLEQGLEALAQAGCTTQLALIRDDNTASWRMFAKRGFHIPNFFKSFFGYSLAAFGYVFLMNFANTGYSLWVKEVGAHKQTTPWLDAGRNVGISMFFTVVVAIGIGHFGTAGYAWFAWAFGYVVGISGVRLVLGYLLARSYGPVRLTLPHSGAILTTVLAARGVWWPHFGFWAPKKPLWHEPDFHKYEGVSSLAGRLVTIGAFVTTLFIGVPTIAEGLRGVLLPVLIYQALPFVPFEGMDGFRVIKWNRKAYIFCVVLTILCIVLAWQ